MEDPYVRAFWCDWQKRLEGIRSEPSERNILKCDYPPCTTMVSERDVEGSFIGYAAKRAEEFYDIKKAWAIEAGRTYVYQSGELVPCINSGDLNCTP